MKDFILRHRKAFLTGIAIYQILGGVTGIFFLLLQYTLAVFLLRFLTSLPVLALLLLMIYSGICYFRKGKELRFHVLTLVNLWLQVFQVSVLGFTFLLYFGPYLSIGINGEFEFLFNIKPATFNVDLGFWGSGRFFFLINFFPIILLAIFDLIQNAKPVDKLDGFLEQQP